MHRHTSQNPGKLELQNTQFDLVCMRVYSGYSERCEQCHRMNVKAWLKPAIHPFSMSLYCCAFSLRCAAAIFYAIVTFFYTNEIRD